MLHIKPNTEPSADDTQRRRTVSLRKKMYTLVLLFSYFIEHPLYAVVVSVRTGIGWSSCVVYAGQLQSHLSWHAFCLGQLFIHSLLSFVLSAM